MIKRVTGWHVLAVILVFFGVIITVNVIFIIQATRTFRGEDEPRSYVQGLDYNSTLAARAEQAALGWTATTEVEDGRVVIFAAGTGNPFFTTDTAAALRGAEIGAEIVLKATKVDGIYTADPKADAEATRYHKLSFDEAISRNLQVMDATAFALCRDQRLPVNVFSIFKPGALRRVVLGEDEGTLVYC